MGGVTCMVTIHGIGFQEPPRPPHDSYPETAGYADGLHANLAAQLSSLSDDPRRQAWQSAQSLPIYVCSQFQGSREHGLERLGKWVDKFGAGNIDTSDAPLVAGDGAVAHVALVYSKLKTWDRNQRPRPKRSSKDSRSIGTMGRLPLPCTRCCLTCWRLTEQVRKLLLTSR
jgi:hypothetical protein